MGNTPCCVTPKEGVPGAETPIEAVKIAQEEKPIEEAEKSYQQTEEATAAEAKEDVKKPEAAEEPTAAEEPKAAEAEAKPDESPVVEEIEKVEKEVEAAVAAAIPEFYEWTVKIQKKDAKDPWGIGIIPSLDKSKMTISHGCALLDEWNNNNKTKTVRRADQVYSVNGATGTSDSLIDEMKKCTEIEIVFRRQAKVVIEVIKKGAFGMTFSGDTDMTIDKIVNPGVIKSYNEACAADSEVIAGDRLVEVNGKAENLLEELKASKEGDKVTLAFQRPAI